MDTSRFLSLCANASGESSNTTSELWLVKDKTSAQVAASFLLLILVVGLPWNLLVVAIILKKKLYTQPTIILLLNLVLTDLFILILQTPLQIWTGFSGEYDYGDTDLTRCQVCQVKVILALFPLTALYTILYMSFDRFMFIYKPLKYDRIITRFRTLLVLGLTWILIAVISTLPLMGYGGVLFDQHVLGCVFDHSHDYNIVVLATSLLSMTPTFVCNVWLLCIVQKNIKTIYSFRRSSSTADSNQDEDKFYKVMKEQRHQKQLHLVWVFGALLCCNMVTWLPITLRAILFRAGIDFPASFTFASIVLFTSQALLHPIVETALIKEVREPHRAFVLYCCLKMKSKNSPNITSSPEPRYGCCGYCDDDTQSPGYSGCGLLDICNAAVLMNYPQSSRSDNVKV